MRVVFYKTACPIIHNNGEAEDQDIDRNKNRVEIAGNKQQKSPAVTMRKQKIHRCRQDEKEDEVERVK